MVNQINIKDMKKKEMEENDYSPEFYEEALKVSLGAGAESYLNSNFPGKDNETVREMLRPILEAGQVMGVAAVLRLNGMDMEDIEKGLLGK